MSGKDFSEVVELIVKEDPRYNKGAYFFVRKALDYTLNGLKESGVGENRKHVSGGQLLEGIRKYALDHFSNAVVGKQLFDIYLSMIENSNSVR